MVLQRIVLLLLLAPTAALRAPLSLRRVSEPAIDSRSSRCRAAAAGGAALAALQPHVAAAVETASGTELPDDRYVVGFALLLLSLIHI